MPSKFLPLPAHTVERLKALPQRVAPLEGLMVDMARFRNLLVHHLYWQLDYERMYDSLQGRLASLEAFASHIGQWLREQG